MNADALSRKSPDEINQMIAKLLDTMYVARISLVKSKETAEVPIFGHAFFPIEVSAVTVKACKSLQGLFDECVRR